MKSRLEMLCAIITSPSYRVRVRMINPHVPEPRLIPMMHRYQCDATNCKKFVYYDEGVGRWFHWAPRG